MFSAYLGPVNATCENRSARERFYHGLIRDRRRSCRRIRDSRPGSGETKAIENHGEAKSGRLTKLSV